ncbi:MAG: F0F1 ATP synthase subunit gamma [Deltaproteobacteria bacterium]|nr:F0F1 ATP synthase subunit gamma [Deltaproteobacteria bacterium]
MSARKALEHRLGQFKELNNILSAMKNLSLMELAKLSRFTETQNRVVHTLETVAEDFHSHFPRFLPPAGPHAPLLLIGSERGFCGDFNEKIELAMEARLEELPQPEPRLIVVGRRLVQRLEGDPRLVAALDGPSVIEDLPATLLKLVETLEQLAHRHGFNPMAVTLIHHQVGEEFLDEPLPNPAPTSSGADAPGVQAVQKDEPPSGESRSEDFVRLFRPVDHFSRSQPRHPIPPLVQMDPGEFHAGLVDEYLFAALHGVFYTSMMAENHRRMQQMQAALQQMEKKIAQWQMRLNSLRQEEITEEIEEIMLSAEALLKKQRLGA